MDFFRYILANQSRYEPETIVYRDLMIAEGTPLTPAEIAALDAENKAINSGVPLVISSATGYLSTVNGTAFVTQCSTDLRRYGLNRKVDFADFANKHAYAYGKAFGTGETLGAGLGPDSTAISDFGTEANSTAGWSAAGTPDTFESTGAGTPDTGSYHFHVVGIGSAYKGFSRSTLAAEKTSGALYHQIYRIKVVSGVALAQIAGTGIDENNTHGAGAYEAGSWYHTANGNAANIYFRTNGVAGEFYVDNGKHCKVLTPSNSGLTLTSTAGETTFNWASIEAGFNPNSATFTITISKD